MEFNTDVFVKKIKKLKKTDQKELFCFDNEAFAYLFRITIKCMGSEESVEVADIDLDAFTSDDIDNFRDYYDEIDWESAVISEKIFGVFERTQPKANKERAVFF